MLRNDFALVDDEDFEYLNQWKWKKSNGYAVRTTRNGKRWRTIKIHRLVISALPNTIVDHINRNRLDNRRSNLRIVTASESVINTSMRSDNTSGCRGVSWNKEKNKWEARIGKNNSTLRLGYFFELNQAIKVRKEAEKKYFGEYTYA